MIRYLLQINSFIRAVIVYQLIRHRQTKYVMSIARRTASPIDECPGLEASMGICNLSPPGWIVPQVNPYTKSGKLKL